MAKQSDNGIKKYALPELLAPCGSPEALDAALLGGADAVYLGTKILNARMNARNFEGDALRDGIAKAHRAGVKVYITMNTAVTDRQMHQAMTSAQDLCKMGADALIVADLGFASMLRKYLPGLPIHASTQCSAHSLDGVRFLAERGFSRVVIARELSKANIEYIVKNSPVPIEIFVHGAMCVSASGQCLLSSFIGGRSGNRGECAQPCRMQYNGGYPLSLKDMCLAGHITEITASGAASLKIEGRMKSPEYVYNVTSVYRRLLDQRRNAGEKEMKLLEASFSRGGFSDGYYCFLSEKTQDQKYALFLRRGPEFNEEYFRDASVYNVIRLYIENGVLREKIVYESEHDGLTGLYNKGKYLSLKEHDFNNPDSVAVFYFDVNNLKTVNDTLGHEAGDQLIVRASQSIASIAGDQIYAFRMGGDEFLVIAPNISQCEAEKLRQLWSRTLDEINRSVTGDPITIACGLEYAQKPYNLDQVIANADDKMYINKKELKQNKVSQKE